MNATRWHLLLIGCLALASCRADEGNTPLPPGESVPIRALDPAPSALRRLTVAQYTSAIHDVFGDDVVVPPPVSLPPDVFASGYIAVDSSLVTISPAGVQQFERAAYNVAHQALDPSRRARFVTCAPSGPSDATCARAALEPLGRRLFRRPMDTVDLDAATTLATTAGATLMDFYAGLEYGIAFLLQSPRFLFREELGVDDPAVPGERAYDGYELASRVAFFLWNAAPDDALLAAADAGQLDDDDGLRMEVERMLADPRAEDGVRELAYEWLGLYGLADLSKDETVYTQYSPDIGPAAREETLRMVAHVFREDADARTLMTTRETFVDRRLASIYHVPAPRTDFDMITFPPEMPRAGLLGEISILALNAHAGSTSPTERGRFIRERLLCEPLPHAPVNVNTQIEPPSPEARTLRQRLSAHRSVAYCAACHARMDPIGLGLEAFDGLGRYRTEDNGAPIDTSGDLDGLWFENALELGQLIHDDPRFGDCIVRQAYRVATGHIETDGERGTLRALSLDFASGGHSLRDLMEAIALSDGFRRATAQP